MAEESVELTSATPGYELDPTDARLDLEMSDAPRRDRSYQGTY